MRILETERLFLSELFFQDSEFIVELVNDPAWIKFIGDREICSIDQARRFIDKAFVNSYEKLGFGLYLVSLKEENTPIGICGFVKRDYLDFPDLGFAFLPDYRGLGYAFESAKALIQFGIGVLEFKTILAIAQPNNSRSIDLLQKLGFVFEKEIKQAVEKNPPKPILLYSLSK